MKNITKLIAFGMAFIGNFEMPSSEIMATPLDTKQKQDISIGDPEENIQPRQLLNNNNQPNNGIDNNLDNNDDIPGGNDGGNIFVMNEWFDRFFENGLFDILER